MVEHIAQKRVGSITYQLRHFKGDNKYVIYRLDDAVMSDGQIHHIPEEATFSEEKKAREYFEKLGS